MPRRPGQRGEVFACVTLPEFEWLWPRDAVSSVGGARPTLMKDFGYPPTQKRPFTVSRIGAAPTWPPAPRAVLRPSAPPMFGDTNVAPAPAQAGAPPGQRKRLGMPSLLAPAQGLPPIH